MNIIDHSILAINDIFMLSSAHCVLDDELHISATHSCPCFHALFDPKAIQLLLLSLLLLSFSY